MSMSVKSLPIAVVLVGAATVLSASAQAATAGGANDKACFYSRQLSSWSDAGRDTVNLKVGIHDYYQLKLLGACPDLNFAETIGLESRPGSDFICSGLDVTIVIPRAVTHTVPERCMGTSLRKLTPEEVAALPPKQKP